MKKKFVTFAITLCVYCTTYSQVVYETTYNANPNSALLGRIKLNQNKTKYLAANYDTYNYSYSYNVNYKLYNLNHSLYKSLPVIADSLYNFAAIPLSIQENLFNTDTIIEIAYTRYNTNSTLTSFKVIDENGLFIFERDSVMGYNSTSVNGLQYDGFFNTESGTKLILPITATGGGGYWSKKEIYSLGGIVVNAVSPIDPGDNEDMISLSPNPSVNYTRIVYKLPDNANSGEIVMYNLNGIEIKRFIVDRTFNDLLISTSDLPAGSYFYSLYADNRFIITKKSIIIK